MGDSLSIHQLSRLALCSWSQKCCHRRTAPLTRRSLDEFLFSLLFCDKVPTMPYVRGLSRSFLISLNLENRDRYGHTPDHAHVCWAMNIRYGYNASCSLS